MKLGVVGAGHVGLVTAAAMASLGHDVTAMDVSSEKIDALRSGLTPFHEPRLDELVREGLAAGLLQFTTSIEDAVSGAHAAFICVGRPPIGQGDRSLGAVEDACREIARAASQGVVLIVKSTVPPGTTERIAKVVRQVRPDLNAVTVSSPEFLREGHAIDDTLRPDRLVVGSDDERGFEVVTAVYASLLERGVLLLRTDPRTAELSKLASNAFLATKLSYANAIAQVSELAGADVKGITEIMGADPRIGPAFLGAGMGYGGYCLPKDVVTLERLSERLGYDFGMLRETTRVNEQATMAIARKVEEAVWNLEGKTIALLGLAFKPGTDDVRGAPALALASHLRAEGAVVKGYDPMAGSAAAAATDDIEIASDPYDAAEGAHCVVVCTEWPEFAALDLARLRGVMGQAIVVDGRNLFDEEALLAAGFQYVPVGRPASLMSGEAR